MTLEREDDLGHPFSFLSDSGIWFQDKERTFASLCF